MTRPDELLTKLLTERQKKKNPVRAIAEMTDLEKMLQGYGLTTAQLFYGLPDHPSVLNTFTHQQYDLAPDFPVLFKFIEFWQREIEGPLRSVEISHRQLVSPGQWRIVTAYYDIP
jgi:uncharacterized protein Usg